MADNADSHITIAHIVRPQGRRGEVLADLFTDFPDLFTTTKHLQLKAPSGIVTATCVEVYWLPTGRNAGRVVLKLSGIESISAAEQLAGFEVQIPSTERVTLDDHTYYVSDLVGCALLDGETRLGTVEDLHFPVDSDGRRLSDAAPLFVVRGLNGQEILVPFANAFVQEIDLATKQVQMSLPPGLVDLNT